MVLQRIGRLKSRGAIGVGCRLVIAGKTGRSERA